MKDDSKKKAKTSHSPSVTKQASNMADPHAYKDQFPAWRFRFMDDGGDWPITEELLPAIIRKRLKGFETTKWSEIEAQLSGGHKKHHSHEIVSLSKPARERWEYLNLNFDTVFRFRFGSRLRLWGIRQNNVFKPVWWDTEHQVYPTEPK